ncbi:hypothetical protein F4824DRAFT_451927 [Ustulina deusta]|nr:hypothetical protein F4824DRAFT_451927 [Ustulina deusta]
MAVTSVSYQYLTAFPSRTVVNYGPLTATFTAAPSCATASNALIIGSLWDGFNSFQLDGYPTCSIQPYDDACFPSAGSGRMASNTDYRNVLPSSNMLVICCSE